MKDQFVAYIHDLQNRICAALEQSDGKAKFIEDAWQRPEGGGGKTRVIANGNVIEKGGVNTSVVYGEVTDAMRTQLKIDGAKWFACGLSLVIHPFNPFVPTVHCNYRMFELYNENDEVIDRWFGGGTDLTPYYLFEEDAKHFHQSYKDVCDQFDLSFYPKFKEVCDNYFVNAHRNNERRGIGGIFYDYQRPSETQDVNFWLNFAKACGDAFIPAYVPIVEKRKLMPFTSENKHWQEIRRGRYTEFNLVHDRGTIFGLKTNGRIESILMSLPPTVRFEYNYQPVPGSEEDKLLQACLHPREWVASEPTEEDRLNWARNANKC
ncbi:coproporphyrinogen III oxidase [Flavisolibacter tropicus]|uniref:coproporphyrinogen oxidase n=1 Tax=Flavisolibacter tropicus TaxID=1492898 RepID=A0A172U290_9BACT|nr:coproporphyrinogen III oxidase [Flavisolibacter tropicus]